MKEDYRPDPSQYDSLIAVRNTELQTYWTRYNLQLILNGGLLIAAFTRDKSIPLGQMPPWVISLGGLSLVAIWLGMIFQGKKWIERWNEQLRFFEEELEEKVYPLFTNIRKTSPADNKWKNMTALAAGVPILFGLGWIAWWASSYVLLGILALLFAYSVARRKRRAEIRAALVEFHEYVDRIAGGDCPGKVEDDEVRLAWLKKVWPVRDLAKTVRQVMDIDRLTAGIWWCNLVEDCLTKGWAVVLPFKILTTPNLDQEKRNDEFEQLRAEYMAAYKKITG